MSAGAEDGLPDLMGHLPSVGPFLILPIGSHAQPLWTLVLENLLETSGFVCSRRSPPGLGTVDILKESVNVFHQSFHCP